jgi:hypothetical protein
MSEVFKKPISTITLIWRIDISARYCFFCRNVQLIVWRHKISIQTFLKESRSCRNRNKWIYINWNSFVASALRGIKKAILKKKSVRCRNTQKKNILYNRPTQWWSGYDYRLITQRFWVRVTGKVWSFRRSLNFSDFLLT